MKNKISAKNHLARNQIFFPENIHQEPKKRTVVSTPKYKK